MDKNIFELATRGSYRFQYNGPKSVEELWELSLPKLDSIYKELNKGLKQASEESLLDVKSAKDEELENKIEVIKHIVKVKQAEAKAIKDAVAKKQEREKLLNALDRKENEELESLSAEEIRKKLAEL